MPATQLPDVTPGTPPDFAAGLVVHTGPRIIRLTDRITAGPHALMIRAR